MPKGRAASIQRNNERRARNVASKPAPSLSAPSSSTTVTSPAPTPAPTTSGSLKDLSISLARQSGGGASGASSGAGSLKDLSISLAGGAKITQDDILDAQSGGPSLASRVAAPASLSAPTAPGSSAQGPTSSPQTGIGGGEGTRYSRYSSRDDDEEEPVIDTPDLEQIQKRMTREAQAEINALNRYEKSLLDEQRGINQQDERSTAAINTLTGLAGSTEANINQQRTTAAGQKANQLIRDQVSVKIQGILSGIRKDALEQYRYERTESRLDSAEARAAAEARKKNATENIALLAETGVTIDGYKNTDPEGYAHLAKQVGGEDILKAMFTLNRPQDTILDKKVEGGKYVIAFQNPLDGKIRIETVDLGLPPQFSKTIDAGDRILAIPDNWSGDPSELITINKGLTPAEANSGTGSGEGGIYEQLDFRTANAILGQADKFAATPIVQTYNAMVGAANMVQGVDPNSKNPADHQAIVYNFAKMLDPESVVREGEYATIAKYSQSTVDKYKGEINRAINGTGFLSAQAIQDIQNASANRLKAYKPQYDNIRKQTANRINQIAGQDVADIVLLDYEAGYTGGAGNVQLKGPDGQIYDASALSEEEYQEAIASGYTPV